MYEADWDNVYRFYYNYCDRNEKICYEALVKGIINGDDKIEFAFCVSDESIKKIYESVMDDYPLFFYVQTYHHSYRGNKSVIGINYRLYDKDIQPMLDKIKKETYSIVQKVRLLKDEEEKEKAIHDYLATSAIYEKDRSYFVHQIIGPFIHKKSVCEGFARAAKYLFDQVGMKSAYVTGFGNCFGGAEGGAHAWNLVYHNGIPSYLDITFDNSWGEDEILYRYYNLSDTQIARNHRLDKPYVKCPEGYDYYTQKGLFVYYKSQLLSLLNHCYSQKIYNISFRVDTKRKRSELEKNILQTIATSDFVLKGRRGYKYRFYESQYIFYVYFM